jgi:predicted ATPase/class 3 adenylate cyclase
MTVEALPTGTPTFLFTDVEGSTRAWEQTPDAMERALALHDEILRRSIGEHGGYVFSTAGDAFAAAFARPSDAVSAAADVQAALGHASWPDGLALRVRIGVHTGEAVERDGDYFGPALNRAARIMSAGHGGQVLVSEATAALLPDVKIIDLGEHRLRDLLAPARLFQLGAESFPPLRVLDVARTNLPTERTELVGRDDEVAEIVRLLDGHRLVTLTGFGGMGKTRLASAAAAEASHRYPSGVYFVGLAPLEDGSQVGAATFEAVGIAAGNLGEGGSPHAAAARALTGLDALLVLDNCEHVVDDVAELVDELLDLGERPTVLATSREALDIEGEHVYRVAPLSVDEQGAGPAVELFVQRALAAGVEVDATDPAVVRIVRSLDGMPLAIELAAARSATLDPSDLADRLERELDVLGGRRRRGRHQSLDAVLRWSWELLDEPSQVLLSELSTFAGGFTLDAAEAVCRDSATVVERLGGLVRGSLVDPSTRPGESRYRMLEPVRQFGARRLRPGERAMLMGRQLDWWLERVRALPEGRQWLSIDWARLIEADFDNLRSTVDHALDMGRSHDVAEVLGGCVAAVFDGVRTPEAELVIERALSARPDNPRLLLAGAFVDIDTGRRRRQADRIARALEWSAQTGDDPCRAVALAYVGFSTATIDGPRACQLAEAATTLAGALDDPDIALLASSWRAITLAICGDSSGARRMLEIGRSIESPGPSLATVHHSMADYFVTLELEGPAAATGALRRAKELAAANASLGHSNWLTGYEALGLATAGDASGVRESVLVGFAASERLRTPTMANDPLVAAAEVLEGAGRLDDARELLADLRRRPLSYPFLYHRYLAARDRLEAEPAESSRTDQELRDWIVAVLDEIVD